MESTHTIDLVFWGSCSPDCRSTAPSIVGSHGHLGWSTKGLSQLLRPVFLGLPLAVKTWEEDQLSILHCPSCDQVGKRFANTNTHNRLFYKYTEFEQVLIWVLLENDLDIQYFFWDRRFLEWQSLFCNQYEHPVEAQVVEEVAHPKEGSAKTTSPEDLRELTGTISTRLDMRALLPSKSQPYQTFSTKL